MYNRFGCLMKYTNFFNMFFSTLIYFNAILIVVIEQAGKTMLSVFSSSVMPSLHLPVSLPQETAVDGKLSPILVVSLIGVRVCKGTNK